MEKLIGAIADAKTDEERKAAVKEAREAYDALTDTQKKLVSNLDKLIAAEKSLASKEDVEAAEAVEKLIDAIADAKTEEARAAAVQKAREAYDKLTQTQKNLVANFAKLEEAENSLNEKKASTYESVYRTTGDFLENLGTPSVGSIGGEWMVIGLKRSGREIPGEEGYYESVVQYIRENIDEQERLHFAKSSENSRMILALTALGRDVTNVGGHNLLMGLNDMEYVQKQGINGPIWALIALDSGNYPVPEGNATRDGLIQVILDAQLADGGWAISGDTGDSDMTGMALQSLAPYRNTREDVGAAVDRAIQLLSEKQNDDGSYSTFSGGGKMVPTSESTAQVIVALSALSIDAGEDSRFVKNGNSAVDALCAYYVDGGGFRHLSDGQRDGMATEQGYYALTAYFRFLQGQTPLYDMTDVIDRGGEIPEETKPVQPISQPKAAEPSLGYSLGTVAVSFLAGAVFAVVLFGGGIAVGFYFAKGRVRKNKE